MTTLMNLIPISKPVRKNNFDEIITIDVDFIIIKTRSTLHQLFEFKHTDADIALTNNCLFPSLLKTNNYDKEIIDLTNEIIDVIYRGLLANTDRSQTGKTNHNNAITQAIDVLVFKGLSLELAVNLTHSIEFDSINAIINVFPLIDSDNFIKTPCKGYFKHDKFFIFAEYIDKEERVLDKQKGFIINADEV